MWPCKVVTNILLHSEEGSVSEVALWWLAELEFGWTPESMCFLFHPSGICSSTLTLLSDVQEKTHLQRFHNKLNLLSSDVQTNSISSDFWLFKYSRLSSPITSVKPQGVRKQAARQMPSATSKCTHSLTPNWCNPKWLLWASEERLFCQSD